MHRCFYCLHTSIVWDADCDFEDFGYEGNGIVSYFHCENCGAEIRYIIPFDNPEEDTERKEHETD